MSWLKKQPAPPALLWCTLKWTIQSQLSRHSKQALKKSVVLFPLVFTMNFAKETWYHIFLSTFESRFTYSAAIFRIRHRVSKVAVCRQWGDWKRHRYYAQKLCLGYEVGCPLSWSLISHSHKFPRSTALLSLYYTPFLFLIWFSCWVNKLLFSFLDNCCNIILKMLYCTRKWRCGIKLRGAQEIFVVELLSDSVCVSILIPVLFSAGSSEDQENTESLVGNAQNLMQTVIETLHVAEGASIKMRVDSGFKMIWRPRPAVTGPLTVRWTWWYNASVRSSRNSIFGTRYQQFCSNVSLIHESFSDFWPRSSSPLN